MNLTMFLGNDLIEAVPVETDFISRPGYLGQYKRFLKEKYKDLIRECPDPPDFFVVNLQAPQLNG